MVAGGTRYSNLSTRGLFAALVVLFSIFGSTNLLAAALVSEAVGVAVPDVERGPEVRRTYPVFINAQALGNQSVAPGENGDSPANVVDIDLFDGKTVTAVLHPARTGIETSGSAANMKAWTGRLVDDLNSSVSMVLNGGILQGNIHSAKHGAHQIRFISASDNLHEVREIDMAGFPEMHPPEHPSGAMEVNEIGAILPPHSHSPDGPAVADNSTGDDGSNIDTLVVYTQASRAAVGGTAAMQTLIGLANVETNDSYTNTGINSQMSVVHMAEVNYNEVGFSTDLQRLRETNDGYMDNVHTLRQTYEADMVGILINSTEYCGLASVIMADFSTAFQATYHGCATGAYVWAHEWGHLQGARHDWFVDPTDNSPFTFNHGFVDPGDQWKTVMAYNNDCGSCPTLPYWSNPDNTYNGQAMGVPEGDFQAADNRKTLNLTAPVVANFIDSTGISNPSIVTPALGSTLSGASQTFSWSDNGTVVERYVVYIGTATGLGDIDSSGNLGQATSYTTNVLPTDGSVVYVRLWYRVAGSWSYTDYSYTAALLGPQIYSPESGATLATTGSLFLWTANGENVTNWTLWLGTTPNSADIYSSGSLGPTVQSTFIPQIESSTGEVHATLWYKVSGSSWQNIQDLYYVDVSDPGYNDQFDGTGGLSNWTINSGGWYRQGGRARIKDATAPVGQWSSMARTNANYSDVDMVSRQYRTGDPVYDSANNIFIRSSGDFSGGLCTTCIFAQWTNNGYFSLWSAVNGSYNALVSWTSTSAINPNGWNEVRIVMVGSRYWYIINGQLVATGTENSVPQSGLTGVSAFKDVELNMWVDYAVVEVPTADTIDMLDTMDLQSGSADSSVTGGPTGVGN